MTGKEPETRTPGNLQQEYAYYPGCSLHSTAREFNDSILAVFNALGISLIELEDWNCCTAASAMTLNHTLSLALPMRNLSIAQRSGRNVVIPCTACYNRHKAAELEMKSSSVLSKKIEEVIGFHYRGDFEVRSLLDVIGNQVGLDVLRDHVCKPLSGLKVVGYYGCLLVRPSEITQFENPENPTLLNKLLEILGAEVHPWSYATDCCGGDQTLVKPEIAVRLVNRLVEHACEAGAEAIVTVCPLCQMSLEMRQSGPRPKMPLFYFSELIGLAFGLVEASAWWNKHLINPLPVLQAAGL
jgi:heterodisulfide reductase subunit B